MITATILFGCLYMRHLIIQTGQGANHLGHLIMKRRDALT